MRFNNFLFLPFIIRAMSHDRELLEKILRLPAGLRGRQHEMIRRQKTHCSPLANSFLFSLFNARYLLLKATEIFFRAKSFSPRNVVFFFNSSNGMISNSFARHSSANELDTTFTPSKSRTTCPSPRSRGSSLFLVSSPNLRVPRFSPTVINLNVVIYCFISGRSLMRMMPQ